VATSRKYFSVFTDDAASDDYHPSAPPPSVDENTVLHLWSPLLMSCRWSSYQVLGSCESSGSRCVSFCRRRCCTVFRLRNDSMNDYLSLESSYSLQMPWSQTDVAQPFLPMSRTLITTASLICALPSDTVSAGTSSWHHGLFEYTNRSVTANRHMGRTNVLDIFDVL